MSYEHLTLGERYVIYHLKLCNFSLREIGRRLGRHHSTISRELERTDEALAKVVKKMNHRPRKCLGYRTPHEVFMQACRGAVAM